MSKPIPEHWKKNYNIYDFESYKDVPGWINDAEFIYKEIVDEAQDGDHGPNVVYNHLINFWPKLKVGGVIAGDDIAYIDVLNDVKKFTKENNLEITYSHNGFKVIKC